MIMLRKRIDALESRAATPHPVSAIMEREADPTAWLLTPGGDTAEKAALWGHILSLVDGRSKGLPHERAPA